MSYFTTVADLNVKLRAVRNHVSGPAVVAGVEDGLQLIKQAALVYLPVDKGTLAASMTTAITLNDPPRRVVGKVTMWGPNGQLPYAWMREKGGTIRPKPTNPTGRLWWRGDDGKMICAVQVTQKGSAYMEKGFKEAKDEATKAIGAVVHQGFQAFE